MNGGPSKWWVASSHGRTSPTLQLLHPSCDLSQVFVGKGGDIKHGGLERPPCSRCVCSEMVTWGLNAVPRLPDAATSLYLTGCSGCILSRFGS